MTGSACAEFAYNREQACIFKGTLLGIVVSFFILILVSFLLNLAESYWYLHSTSFQKAETANERVISGGANDGNDGYVSWHKFFGIKTAQAATYSRADYKANILIRSAKSLELAPGEEISYRIGFKNTGKAPWNNDGRNFISIYTYNPKYRNSDFQGSGWYRAIQPAKLRESQVNSGALGFIEFKIKAPQKEGDYIEIYHLAAEDKAWIEGGEFSIPISVKKGGSTITPIVSQDSSSPITNYQLPISNTNNQPTNSAVQPISNANQNFQASLLLASHKEIKAKAGEVVDLRLGFKNIGKEKWNLRGILADNDNLLADGHSIFYYPTWTSGHQPAVKGNSPTNPGELSFLDFKLQIPEVAGEYKAKFKLVADYDKEVAGGDIEIPVYVTDESIGADQSGQVINRLNMQEPDLEIGLYYLTDNSESVELTADKNYQIRDKAGASLANLSAYESVNIKYDFNTKIFTLKNARLNLDFRGELHFIPLNEDAVFTILSMSRTDSYGYNFNKYRDGIILRQADTTGRLWVINKLPMEHYLWGIAETSNLSPLDYIKSIIVASRTYALYHYLNPYKYGGYFTMRATTADQLYQGYNAEIQRSRVKQAVQETSGQAITYGGDIVVTPYFGHSDGRTRSWQEVWGGTAHPWVVSVPVPSDQGRTLWGHGVGMSAKGAYHNAQTDGWDYSQILNYYYKGIEVSRVY